MRWLKDAKPWKRGCEGCIQYSLSSSRKKELAGKKNRRAEDVQPSLVLRAFPFEIHGGGAQQRCKQSLDARLDVRCHGFWERQRAAFFDIRVCHPNADSYKELTPKQIYQLHENEKKRKYGSRVTEVEQGTFTPLVFTTTGGMANECLHYHSRLAEPITAKKQETYSTTISWIRAKVSFAILRSALLCIRARGSRAKRRRSADVKERDLEIDKESAGLNWTLFIIDFSSFYQFFINFDSTFYKKIIIIN